MGGVSVETVVGPLTTVEVLILPLAGKLVESRDGCSQCIGIHPTYACQFRQRTCFDDESFIEPRLRKLRPREILADHVLGDVLTIHHQPTRNTRNNFVPLEHVVAERLIRLRLAKISLP